MAKKLPPFPANVRSATLQIRRGARAVDRTLHHFVGESERLTYFRLGKFPHRRGQLQRTAMARGRSRKAIERWLDRLETLLVFGVSDELYAAVRQLAICTGKIFMWCDRIPRKGYWGGDLWCQRLSGTVYEIERLTEKGNLK